MFLMSRVFLSLTLLASLSSCERGYTIDVPAASVGRVSFRGDGGAWRDANLTQQQVVRVWRGYERDSSGCKKDLPLAMRSRTALYVRACLGPASARGSAS